MNVETAEKRSHERIAELATKSEEMAEKIIQRIEGGRAEGHEGPPPFSDLQLHELHATFAGFRDRLLKESNADAKSGAIYSVIGALLAVLTMGAGSIFTLVGLVDAIDAEDKEKMAKIAERVLSSIEKEQARRLEANKPKDAQ